MKKLFDPAVLDEVSPEFRALLAAGLAQQSCDPLVLEPMPAKERSAAPIKSTPAKRAPQLEAFPGEAIGFMARLLVQATMPHAKTDEHFYERKNGNVCISMATTDRNVGLPYGHYPRLLMCWVTREAVRNRSPVLELGDSLSAFMRQLGLVSPESKWPTGGQRGTIARLRDHMQRLFCSAVSWTHEGKGSWQRIGVHPVKTAQLWWDPKQQDQVTLWKSTITLDQDFYDEIVRHPVPLDLRVLKALATMQATLAIDIYAWLTYRMSYMEKPTMVPWAALALQFGGNYGRTRDFKKKFVRWLKVVKQLYPSANVAPTDAGVMLVPSPTHVPMLS